MYYWHCTYSADCKHELIYCEHFNKVYCRLCQKEWTEKAPWESSTTSSTGMVYIDTNSTM